jgi:hypothetical protein
MMATEFYCALCARTCRSEEHGAHEHTDGTICDDCKGGLDDERDEPSTPLNTERDV